VSGLRHEMVLEKNQPPGAEKWYCPVCGRCMLVKWKPRFMRILLEVGDESVIHTGGKGSLAIGSLQVATKDNTAPQEERHDMFSEDFWLKPWIEWLDEVDFENLWKD